MSDPRIAWPGDADLDLDLDCITITSVVQDGRDVLFRATGGFGQWVSDGQRRDVTSVTEGNMHLHLIHTPREWVDAMVMVLERWRDCATPLRLCMAPDRLSALIEDNKTWLALPRKPFPGGPP